MMERNKMPRRFYAKELIMQETVESTGVDAPTAMDVLEYMMGDDDTGRCANYVVYSYAKITERRFIQRLNLLWVYPLFIITIPLQFLLHGDIGVNKDSKIGSLIHWLVKFD